MGIINSLLKPFGYKIVPLDFGVTTEPAPEPVNPRLVSLDKLREALNKGPTVSISGKIDMPRFAEARAKIMQQTNNFVVLFSASGWNDVITDAAFYNLIDPSTRFEELNSGYLGAMLGSDIYTDAILPPSERFTTPSGVALDATSIPTSILGGE